MICPPSSEWRGQRWFSKRWFIRRSNTWCGCYPESLTEFSRSERFRLFTSTCCLQWWWEDFNMYNSTLQRRFGKLRIWTDGNQVEHSSMMFTLWASKNNWISVKHAESSTLPRQSSSFSNSRNQGRVNCSRSVTLRARTIAEQFKHNSRSD